MYSVHSRFILMVYTDKVRRFYEITSYLPFYFRLKISLAAKEAQVGTHYPCSFLHSLNALFQHLIDSNGIVDESVLEKLKLNIRSLITSEEGNNKELLDLCIDVIYHNNKKAFGLHQLILLYIQWEKEKNKDEEEI